MNQPPDPNAQEQALIRILEAKRNQSCEAIRKQADEQCAALLEQAYRDARKRLGLAIREERARAKRQIEMAQAQVRTGQRQRELRLSRLRLERGWELLPKALERRWQADASRAAWVKAVLREALAVLPPGEWTIHHAPAWSAQEIKAVGELVAQRIGKTPRFQADQGIAAGIRIRLDGTCVDGSIPGLLANRAWVKARLLGEINRALDAH